MGWVLRVFPALFVRPTNMSIDDHCFLLVSELITNALCSAGLEGEILESRETKTMFNLPQIGCSENVTRQPILEALVPRIRHIPTWWKFAKIGYEAPREDVEEILMAVNNLSKIPSTPSGRSSDLIWGNICRAGRGFLKHYFLLDWALRTTWTPLHNEMYPGCAR